MPPRERTAWLVAGLLCLVLLAAIVFTVARNAQPPAAPDMANAGAISAQERPGPSGPAGPAPDISQMTPRERFDRLFNRVMQAAEQGDTAQVGRFTPMALGAYAQLDSINADARYHAAVLRMQVGDLAGADALADTILTRTPGHLLGYLVRGTTAGFRGDTAGVRRHKSIRTDIDPVITRALSENRIVGTVVLIAQDGEVVYQHAAGLADRESGQEMGLDTLFRLASVTKPIVCATAMTQIEVNWSKVV